MEKLAILTLLLLGLWIAMKVARFFVRLVLVIIVILIAVVAYYVYLR